MNLAITQARTNSTRLPNKVLMKIGNKTLLQIHLERAMRSTFIDQLIVATTTNPGDDKIIEICNESGIKYYRGSENDVLDRYYQAATLFKADNIIRITSDCPLIDPAIIDKVGDAFKTRGLDFVSNTLKPTYPDGMDVEIFRFNALKKAHAEATLKSDREHVTPYIWRNCDFNKQTLFTAANIENKIDLSQIRLTVDEMEDFKVIEELLTHLPDDLPMEDYLNYMKKFPTLLNSKFKRNEGYQKSISND